MHYSAIAPLITGEPASDTAGVITTSQLPYGPMPKEKTSGNVIPMPQRKVI
jgi:hypothetical protein